MKKKYVTIVLFSGTGGSDEGTRNAGGYITVLAADYDNHAETCFRMNFPEIPFWNVKISSELTGQDILDKANEEMKARTGKDWDLKPGDVDLLLASPPCPGFSMAKGVRNINDERNDLFDETIRLIKEIQPKVAVIENVKGMIMGKMKKRTNQIIDKLEDNSFNYTYEYCVLNSLHYGVPQKRERLIFILVRNDLVNDFGLKPFFPEPDLKGAEKLRIKDVLPYVDYIAPGQFDNNKKRNTGFCPTITATASMEFYENGVKRKPTIDEVKLLCSFPQNFKLTGSYQQQYARLGNAVPPKLMEAITKTIKEEILDVYYRNLGVVVPEF